MTAPAPDERAVAARNAREAWKADHVRRVDAGYAPPLDAIVQAQNSTRWGTVVDPTDDEITGIGATTDAYLVIVVWDNDQTRNAHPSTRLVW